MKGPSLRTIQTRFDLSHDTMVQRIAVATDSVAGWERNELAIQESMEHVIRSLESPQ